jgi:UDP-N-acetylglucosamine--dolichyl-phosphate N-acetylglucosaminephosphotransferase
MRGGRVAYGDVPADAAAVHQLSPEPHVVWSVELQLLAYVSLAVIGFMTTSRLVPVIKTYTLRKGLSGKDLGKKGIAHLQDLEIPEALGIVPGAVFLVCLVGCLVGFASSNSTGKLLDCNSALLSINFMLFLGFTDDVLDWPWRYKLFLPSVASLPLLCCYTGSTSILVPIPLRQFLMDGAGTGQVAIMGQMLEWIPFLEIDRGAMDGSILHLGVIYLIYMGLLSVFCTNAINIYAGINGLEAGQSYVIGCAILFHNLWEMQKQDYATGSPGISPTTMTTTTTTYNDSTLENHLFSCMVMLSFVGCTAGLLRHNWYPATVFVGDTYCYFAGMTFAVVGILGHFSKTLLLLFIPQILNFLYSTPQLFKRLPCPRHRLPRFDSSDGKLHPSTFVLKRDSSSFLQKLLSIRKSKVTKDDIEMVELANCTVINAALQICGPMTERDLCVLLLAFQGICCAFGLLCKHYVSHLIF